MNEPKNNSILSTIVFLCVAALLIFAITIASEDFTPTRLNNLTNSSTKTQ